MASGWGQATQRGCTHQQGAAPGQNLGYPYKAATPSVKVFGLCFHSVCFRFQFLIVRFPGSNCKYDTVRLQMLHHSRLLVFLVVFVCYYCHARFVRLHICCYNTHISSRSNASLSVIVAGIVARLWCWIGMGNTISASSGVAAVADIAGFCTHTIACRGSTVSSCLSSTVVPCQQVILSTGKGPPIRSFCRQHRHRQSFRLQFRRRQLLRQ